MREESKETKKGSLKEELWRIIFEAETPSGRRFDVALLWVIAASVLVVILESVPTYREQYGTLFHVLEWFFTILFTIEYGIRLWLVRRPWRYVFSFYGIVDLLSCLPTYLALFLPWSMHSLLIVRIFRLLRMFRILKMISHVEGANLLMRSIYASRAKITVFLFSLAVFAVIVWTLAYLFESGENGGIDSIPMGIYWAVVTMTTLGYGDVTPLTIAGKCLTVVTSLSGFAIIAVPTGIFVSEVANIRERSEHMTEACPGCGKNGHLPDAKYCRVCGEKLDF